MLQCNIAALGNKRMEDNHQFQVTYATWLLRPVCGSHPATSIILLLLNQ